MNEQKELTKAELQIMQILWQKGSAFVNDILQDLEEPRPAYNTVSTVLRVLQNKGFVAYNSYGKTYQYYPLVTKESYTNRFMNRVVDNFFSGSVKAMVSFFTKKEKMSVQEIDELIKMLEENKELKSMIEFDWSEWVILRFIGASFILWLCYYLLYDRKAAFNQCRKFLLFSVLLAMVVAVVRIPVYPKEIIPINDLQSIIHETQTNEISETKIEALGIQSDVPETVISEGGNEPAMPLEESPFYASWDYMQIAWSIYGIGVFILLLHLSIEIIRIKRLQRWGSCTTDTDGIHIVRNNNVSSPFSFYRTIFIHRKLEGEVLQVVVLHEKTHIFFHHYRDTFFIECMSVLFWFNPFVWLIKRELRALHEFQVDNSLLSVRLNYLIINAFYSKS